MKQVKKPVKRSRRTRKPSPIQGKKPANKNLLPKRERDSLSSAVATLNSQQISTYPGGMSIWEYKRASTPGGVRLRGREAAGTLLASATTAVGAFQLLNVSNSQGTDNSLPLQPFFSSRLERMAEIFEHYKFHEWSIDLVPYKPTSTAGVYFGAVDCMASDDTGTLYTNQSKFLDNMINCLQAIYSVGRMVYTGNLAQLARYALSVVGDTTGNQAGRALNMQAISCFGCQGVNTTSGESLATLVVTYDVEFFSPTTPETSAPPNLSGYTKGQLFRKFYRERNPPAGWSSEEIADLVRENNLIRKMLTGARLDDYKRMLLSEVDEEMRKTVERKDCPSNVKEEKRKFDPQHSDGDIPNIDSEVDGKELAVTKKLHLKLGDGNRWYRCPGTKNSLIDLQSTERIGYLDPFTVPLSGTTFKGYPPRYYPSIGRINFCPCGCNDPKHEKRTRYDEICNWCGSEEGCVSETFDYVSTFKVHERSLDPRSAFRSMDPKDFWNCCLAVWSRLQSEDEKAQVIFDSFVESELCTVYPCTGIWTRHDQFDNQSDCVIDKQHLCCLSPVSLMTLSQLLHSSFFPMSCVRNLNPKPAKPSTREEWQKRMYEQLTTFRLWQAQQPAPKDQVNPGYSYLGGTNFGFIDNVPIVKD